MTTTVPGGTRSPRTRRFSSRSTRSVRPPQCAGGALAGPQLRDHESAGRPLGGRDAGVQDPGRRLRAGREQRRRTTSASRPGARSSRRPSPTRRRAPRRASARRARTRANSSRSRSCRPRRASKIALIEIAGNKVGDVCLRVRTEKGALFYAGDFFANIRTLPSSLLFRLVFKLTNSGPGLKVFGVFFKFFVADKGAARDALISELEANPPAILVPAHGDVVVRENLGPDAGRHAARGDLKGRFKPPRRRRAPREFREI